MRSSLGSSQERTTGKLNEDDGVERRRLEGQVKTTEWAVECSCTCGKGFVCSHTHIAVCQPQGRYIQFNCVVFGAVR